MDDVDDLAIASLRFDVEASALALGRQREQLQELMVRRWERRVEALAVARERAARDRKLLNQAVVCTALNISEWRLWTLMRDGTIRWQYNSHRRRKIPAGELARCLAEHVCDRY